MRGTLEALVAPPPPPPPKTWSQAAWDGIGQVKAWATGGGDPPVVTTAMPGSFAGGLDTPLDIAQKPGKELLAESNATSWSQAAWNGVEQVKAWAAGAGAGEPPQIATAMPGSFAGGVDTPLDIARKSREDLERPDGELLPDAPYGAIDRLRDGLDSLWERAQQGGQQLADGLQVVTTAVEDAAATVSHAFMGAKANPDAQQQPPLNGVGPQPPLDANVVRFRLEKAAQAPSRAIRAQAFADLALQHDNAAPGDVVERLAELTPGSFEMKAYCGQTLMEARDFKAQVREQFNHLMETAPDDDARTALYRHMRVLTIQTQLVEQALRPLLD